MFVCLEVVSVVHGGSFGSAGARRGVVLGEEEAKLQQLVVRA
jgi:hypothetical protein